VKTIIHGTLRLIFKVRHNSDLNTACDAFRILQTEAKTSSKNTAQTLDAVKAELENSASRTPKRILLRTTTNRLIPNTISIGKV
jgi:hypothetical protein